MEQARPEFQKYLFVCENERTDGRGCCGAAGAGIRGLLKERIKTMGLDRKVRVVRAGCFDACADGPNVLLMPDNVWFKRVLPEDVESIVASAVTGKVL